MTSPQLQVHPHGRLHCAVFSEMSPLLRVHERLLLLLRTELAFLVEFQHLVGDGCVRSDKKWVQVVSEQAMGY